MSDQTVLLSCGHARGLGLQYCRECERYFRLASLAPDTGMPMAGTPLARLTWLLGELVKRFPEAHRPFASDPPESRYLAALDALKQERDLWQRRAEAMADPKNDSEFDDDQILWRRMAVVALEENGWLRPEFAVELKHALSVAHDEALVRIAKAKAARFASDLEDP